VSATSVTLCRIRTPVPNRMSASSIRTISLTRRCWLCARSKMADYIKRRLYGQRMAVDGTKHKAIAGRRVAHPFQTQL
jgi:hypothetical protein